MTTPAGPENPGLRADEPHARWLERMSAFPAQYHMTQFAFPPPPEGCARAACKQGAVGGALVAREARPELVKFKLRGCGQLPQTELFGTAPYTVTGRGELTDTDTSTMLRNAVILSKDGARACWTEKSAFAFQPRALPPLPPREFDARGGTLTNMDPQLYYASGGR